jgi:heme-degrading monooxygenase HmoA
MSGTNAEPHGTADGLTGPVSFMTVLTPKPGKLAEFLAIQLAQHRLLAGKVPGLRGVRVYRELDEKNVILLAVYDSPGDHKRWMENAALIEHAARIAPLIERTDRGYYKIEYQAGNVATGTAADPAKGPVMWLNIVTPQPGKLDAFLEIQIAEQGLLRGKVPGLRGNRVYRSLEGSNAVMLAAFDSIAGHKQWLQSNHFAAHLQTLARLIERADRGYYETVFEAGSI